jgi:hypothetical protein
MNMKYMATSTPALCPVTEHHPPRFWPRNQRYDNEMSTKFGYNCYLIILGNVGRILDYVEEHTKWQIKYFVSDFESTMIQYKDRELYIIYIGNIGLNQKNTYSVHTECVRYIKYVHKLSLPCGEYCILCLHADCCVCVQIDYKPIKMPTVSVHDTPYGQLIRSLTKANKPSAVKTE